MSFFWKPKIDEWIPESYAGSTQEVSEPHLNVPPPHLTDYVGTQNYSSESEEMKVSVAGYGKLTMKELKDKIVEILDDIASSLKNEQDPNVDTLEHKLFRSPDLENLVKQYAKHVKMLRTTKEQ